MNDTNMLKEIFEIDTLEDCCLKNSESLKQIASEIKAFNPKNIVIAARGTSLHAGIFAKYLMEINLGIPTSIANPSVFTVFDKNLNLKDSLVIAITQSGKGYDISTVLKKANMMGAYTLTITNNKESLVMNETKHVLFNEIGEAKSGAATKGFTTTLYLLNMLTAYLSDNKDLLLDTTKYLEAIKAGLNLYEDVKKISMNLENIPCAVTIGRGWDYAIAKELALKLMETCLYPVTSFQSSEFCHGPLASTNENTPVFLFSLTKETHKDIKTVSEYLKDTKAPVIAITNNKELATSLDKAIYIENDNDIYAFYTGVIAMQLLSSEMSYKKGTYKDHVPVLAGRTNTF